MKKLIIVLMIVIALLPAAIGCGGSSGYGELEEAYVVFSAIKNAVDWCSELGEEQNAFACSVYTLNAYSSTNSYISDLFMEKASIITTSNSKEISRILSDFISNTKNKIDGIPESDYCIDIAKNTAITFLERAKANNLEDDLILCYKCIPMVLYHPDTPQSWVNSLSDFMDTLSLDDKDVATILIRKLETL